MTSLHDLVDPAGLAAAIQDGYIRVKEHPTLPLRIYNYAERAQYERFWTQETRTCRGLIVDNEDRVVARPWQKFFNYGEHEAGHLPPLDLTARVQVTDKMDGSLGILYPTRNGQHAVATRGSFISEQAQHATAIYRERYHGKWSPDPNETYLFEIVYPSNRIVVDYGQADDLYLLGVIDNATGQAWGPRLCQWPGPRTHTYDYATLAAALAAEPRPNAEGLVVKFDDGTMVKIKQEDYVALHKLVTGLNERVVWEHLAEHGTADKLLAAVPDEFHGWVRSAAADLTEQHDSVLTAARLTHELIVSQIGTDAARKDYAAQALAHRTVTPYLFNLLDGRDPSPGIWKQLRPRGDTYMLGITEDVA